MVADVQVQWRSKTLPDSRLQEEYGYSSTGSKVASVTCCENTRVML
jgi:hypothetical protein